MPRGRPPGSKNKPKNVLALNNAVTTNTNPRPPASISGVTEARRPANLPGSPPAAIIEIDSGPDWKREYDKLFRAAKNVLEHLNHKCNDISIGGDWLLDIKLGSEFSEKRFTKKTDPLFQLEYEMGIIGNKYA